MPLRHGVFSRWFGKPNVDHVFSLKAYARRALLCSQPLNGFFARNFMCCRCRAGIQDTSIKLGLDRSNAPASFDVQWHVNVAPPCQRGPI